MRTPLFAFVAIAVATALISGCMINDGKKQTIAIAGSDTTENVMAAVAALYNADAAYNKDPDNIKNILSVQSAPLVVPADVTAPTTCPSITYHSPPGGGEVASPNGSSAGRDALKASVIAGDGCIDIARSSGPPRAIGTDLATFEYYAYGLDALGWATASALAPANLTHAQLMGIYNCTFTDWSQVGGAAGPIQRYWPQAGSGTRQFAQSDLITFDPTLFSGPGCPAVVITQENTGQLIAANGDQAKAIVPYSGANWVAGALGTQPDQRAGQVIHDLNGQNIVHDPGGTPALNTGAFGGPVLESNVKLNNPVPPYPAIRYVFNVIDSTHVSYKAAQYLVGFQNLAASDPSIPTASKLCDGTYASTISSFGFGPLDATTSSHNLLGSRCRLFTP
jgi:phosphate transport system substrate-binding protein